MTATLGAAILGLGWWGGRVTATTPSASTRASAIVEAPRPEPAVASPESTVIPASPATEPRKVADDARVARCRGGRATTLRRARGGLLVLEFTADKGAFAGVSARGTVAENVAACIRDATSALRFQAAERPRPSPRSTCHDLDRLPSRRPARVPGRDPVDDPHRECEPTDNRCKAALFVRRAAAAALPKERALYLHAAHRSYLALFDQTGEEQHLCAARKTYEQSLAVEGQPDKQRESFVALLGDLTSREAKQRVRCSRGRRAPAKQSPRIAAAAGPRGSRRRGRPRAPELASSGRQRCNSGMSRDRQHRSRGNATKPQMLIARAGADERAGDHGTHASGTRAQILVRSQARGGACHKDERPAGDS
jgi:hypothetical protein